MSDLFSFLISPFYRYYKHRIFIFFFSVSPCFRFRFLSHNKWFSWRFHVSPYFPFAHILYHIIHVLLLPLFYFLFFFLRLFMVTSPFRFYKLKTWRKWFLFIIFFPQSLLILVLYLLQCILFAISDFHKNVLHISLLFRTFFSFMIFRSFVFTCFTFIPQFYPTFLYRFFYYFLFRNLSHYQCIYISYFLFFSPFLFPFVLLSHSSIFSISSAFILLDLPFRAAMRVFTYILIFTRRCISI